MRSRRRIIIILLLVVGTYVYGKVSDTFLHRGIWYQITKEDPIALSYEVSAVQYDTSVVQLQDSVAYNGMNYAVTNSIQWYNPANCSLRHYAKIDMSGAKHISYLSVQCSGMIDIDTLILPPNLQRFPSRFWTVDSLKPSVRLMDEENLLPGIHRVWSTGKQALEDLSINYCTSLIEADLSSYTSTFKPDAYTASPMDQFGGNPFLQKLHLPNTITTFYDGIFRLDIRLTELTIPDSLEAIYGIMTEELPIDTLRLGRKVSYISPEFADSWKQLQSIEVNTTNPYFMDDDGVLYTKDQTTLCHYPYNRPAASFQMSPKTDSLWTRAFAYGWQESDIEDERDWVLRLQSIAESAPLKTLECSSALTYIGDNSTFMGTSIRQINKFSENSVKDIPIFCFRASAIDSIALPFHLESIGALAFSYAYNLKRISNMSKLSNLRVIGESAFSNAWKLEEINLLSCDKVSEIPEFMCSNDSALSFVSLPRKVQSIGNSAFAGCVALNKIICPAVIPITIDSSVFEGVDKQECVLKVLPRSLKQYKDANVWKEFFQMDTTGFYYIETSVSDSLAGFVTGGGAYLSGEYAAITAEAKPGYRFVSWNDGYTYRTRYLQVTHDDSFTALFEKILFYTLTVLPNDSTMGEVSGSGLYEAGSMVTLTATPYEEYCFSHWDFMDLSAESIVYTMPAFNDTIHAFFKPREEAIEQAGMITSDDNKVLKDGMLYILRDNKTYTLQGQEVK